LGGVKKEVGFTLIELLVVIGIISILATIAISYYQNYKIRAFDTAAKSDLKNAMIAIEAYVVENQSYPANYSDLPGFNFSEDVCFTKYELEIENGKEHVHMHIMHTASTNAWHTEYPKDGGDVEQRDPDDCE